MNFGAKKYPPFSQIIENLWHSNSSIIEIPWVDYQTSNLELQNFRFGGAQQIWFRLTISRKQTHAMVTVVIPIYVLVRVVPETGFVAINWGP